MSSLSYIFYKIKGTKLPAYDTVSFEGLNISTAELKKAIMTKKKMGLSSEVELMVEDEQSGKEYRDEELIPKLKKVVVSRRVVGNIRSLEPGQQELPKLRVPPDPDEYEKKKAQEAAEDNEVQNIFKTIMESSNVLDPSKYLNMPKPQQPPPKFSHHQHQTCYRCGKPGHLSAECSSGGTGKFPKVDYSDIKANDVRLIKRPTGIPKSELMPVDSPHYKGAVRTAVGYAVPKIDARAHNEVVRRRQIKAQQPSDTKSVTLQDAVSVPSELKCGLCNDLLRDAVLTLCCNESFCDDCIREALLSSEGHLCPKCQKSCAPASLVPNSNIRNFVRSFANENNYTPLKLQAKQESAAAVEPEPITAATVEDNQQSQGQVNDSNSRRSPPVVSVDTRTAHEPQKALSPPEQEQAHQQQQQPGITVVMMQPQYPGNFMVRPPFMNNIPFPQPPTAGMFPPAVNQQANQMAMMQAFINQLRPIMAQHQFNEQQQQQFLETQIRQFQEQMAQQQQQQLSSVQPELVVSSALEPVVPSTNNMPTCDSVVTSLSLPTSAQPILPTFAHTNPVLGLAARAAAAGTTSAPFLGASRPTSSARPPAHSFAEQLTALVRDAAAGGMHNSSSNTDAIKRFLTRDLFPSRRHDRSRRRSHSRSPRRRSHSRHRSRSRSRSPPVRSSRGNYRRSRSRSPSPYRGRSDREHSSHHRDRDRALKSSKSSSSKSASSASSASAQISNALTALRAAGLSDPSAQLQSGALSKMSKRDCEKMMDDWFEKVRSLHGEEVEKLYRTAYQPYINALLAATEKSSSSPGPSKERGEKRSTDAAQEAVSSTVSETTITTGGKDALGTLVVVDEVSSSDKKESADADGEKRSKKKKHHDELGVETEAERKAKKKEKKEKKHKKENDGDKEKKKKKHKDKSDTGVAENGTIEDEEKRKDLKRLRKQAKEARRRERAEKRERKLLKKQKQTAVLSKSSSIDEANKQNSRSRSKEASRRDDSDGGQSSNHSRSSRSFSRSRSRSVSRGRNENYRSRSRSVSRDKKSSSREKERQGGLLESYVVPASYSRLSASPGRSNRSQGSSNGAAVSKRVGGSKY